MTSTPYDRLIRGLAADLKPVRRLPSPVLRAFAWLAMVAALAAGLASFADLTAVWERIIAAPDMWLAVIGSTLTAVLAVIVAFELSLPDASRGWAVLPLPAVVLWIAASGFGCLRGWIVPQSHVAALGEARDCLIFIVALSVPLSALLLLMLRRAFPLYPGMTAAIGGLAVAAAAATLLNFFHPYDAAATDLAVHAGAVAIVVVANRALGGRVFGPLAYAPINVTEGEVAPN
ncbi:MAG: NrsF family protein [Xanthobacteraceae bacterium]|nr:NrsF family protein [Xanthobacteraceae bacterium]